MAKEDKKKYKQFTIDTLTDACLVLSTLISGVILNLEKYEEYAVEACELLKNVSGEYIAAKEYDDVNDKLLFRQRELLRLIADCQSSSFSYKSFRQILEKKKYLVEPLPQETSQLLNELLDVRNWTFHNAQSILVAEREVANKSIPDFLKGMVQITPQLNPIIINKCEKYETIMLYSLILHSQKRIEQFHQVLQTMKKDYQKMYDLIEPKQIPIVNGGLTSEVQYQEIPYTERLKGFTSDVAQVSMAIQKSKYDGTDQKYKEWVLPEIEQEKKK